MELNLHGSPGFSFCASALEKRGPFQIDSEVNSDCSFPYSKRINRIEKPFTWPKSFHGSNSSYLGKSPAIILEVPVSEP